MISACVLTFCVHLVSINHAFYELELKYGALEYRSNETAHKFESLDNALVYNGRIAIEQAIQAVISEATQDAVKSAELLVKKALSEGRDAGSCYKMFEKTLLLIASDSVEILEPCLNKFEEKYSYLSNDLRIGKLNGHELASIVHRLPHACSEYEEAEEYECFKENMETYSEKQYYLSLRYDQLEQDYKDTVSIGNDAIQCIKGMANDIQNIVYMSVEAITDCLESE